MDGLRLRFVSELTLRAQPIFQDSNGLAIKFFIQKDIPNELREQVQEQITVISTSDYAKVSAPTNTRFSVVHVRRKYLSEVTSSINAIPPRPSD